MLRIVETPLCYLHIRNFRHSFSIQLYCVSFFKLIYILMNSSLHNIHNIHQSFIFSLIQSSSKDSLCHSFQCKMSLSVPFSQLTHLFSTPKGSCVHLHSKQIKTGYVLIIEISCITFYLWIRPEPSPPASFSTSATVTMLKSPSMECFSAEAATANSTAAWVPLPDKME